MIRVVVVPEHYQLERNNKAVWAYDIPLYHTTIDVKWVTERGSAPFVLGSYHGSGRELTVQELSLYRPAPFRTPVERA